MDDEEYLLHANVIAVVAPAFGDYKVPSEGEIKDREDAVVRGQVEVTTLFGKVKLAAKMDHPKGG